MLFVLGQVPTDEREQQNLSRRVSRHELLSRGRGCDPISVETVVGAVERKRPCFCPLFIDMSSGRTTDYKNDLREIILYIQYKLGYIF